MTLNKMCALFLLPAAFLFFPPTADFSPPGSAPPHFPASTQLQDDSLVWRASAPEYGKVYTSEDCGNASVIPLSPV